MKERKKAMSLSYVWVFATPCTVACQTPPSMDFPGKNTGVGCHFLLQGMLSFKSAFSLSSFTFIKKLFRSSSLSAIRVVSSPYLRLLIFVPGILIPACESSSPAFHLMYSAYKLNKQGDNTQPWRTPFPNFEPVCCSMSGSNCYFLNPYRFLRKRVRWSGIPISLRLFYGLLWSTQSKALA